MKLTESVFELPAPHEAGQFRRASSWVTEFSHNHGIPHEQCHRFELFLNEALANTIDHGGLGAHESPINLHFKIEQDGVNCTATLTVIDSGAEFDPVKFVPRPNPESLDEAIPGGLGIQLMRSLSDELLYTFNNGKNHLSCSIRCELPARFEHAQSAQIQNFGHGPDRRLRRVSVSKDSRKSGDRRVRRLDWLPLFHNADENSIQEIIKNCDVLNLSAGTALLKPGYANDSVYILLSGKLAAYLDTDLNPNLSIPIMPGECIGELSAIDGKPVTALVMVTENARVLRLTSDKFLNKLMAVPGVARNLLMVLTERMRRTNVSMLESQRKQLELEHLRKELEVARQLQASMLPIRQPMFPERTDINIAAVMEPASEVGGDLFDAFFIDDHRLFFCIGDVSGHGIPAALFMARSIGLMRIAAMSILDPGKLIERINDQLCIGNDTNLFVTLFCAVLDVSTGHMVYANGGHCAPILVRNGQASPLPVPKGTLVGAIPELSYTSSEIVLEFGDTLACFTDGVTEAQSNSEEEFSDARLISLLQDVSNQSLEDIQSAILGEVMKFTGSRNFDDDYTLLMLTRNKQ